MVATTSHIFSGKVDIASNLQVGSSHLFVDTENNRVGITTASPDATLHVNGNVYATRFEGDGSLLTGIASNLEQITNNGNVTSNAVQFTNPDTGIITTGNVDVGNKLSVASLTPGSVPYIDGENTFADSHITQGTDKVSITSNLEITGNILVSGETYKIDSQSLEVKDRIVGIAYDNTLSGADTGILMEYPTKNIGLIHHGASGNPYAQEFTIGYTQNTATDTTILNDPTNKITVNVLGDLHTQNNMTVDSGGSYFGDGTTLTGVALATDMTSNAARIANIETVNGTQTGLITGLRADMTSNASRMTTLETANTVQAGLITSIKSDVTSNTTRISTLEAANTVQASLITAIETDVTDNAARITSLEAANTVQAGLITAIEADVTDNASRITTLEAANTVQTGLITAIEADVTDNAARITTLEAANTVQASLITAIETDVSDNAARITTLEAANTVQAGLITAIETDVADNATRITNLDTDLTDNASRVTALEATDAVYSGLLTGLRTDVDDNDTRIVSLESANTVQAGLITGLRTDLEDTFITKTSDSTIISSNLEVTGNIFMRGDRFVVESETTLINDAIIGIANNNTVSTTDVGILMQRPTANVALVHHGGTDTFTIGYTQDTLEATDITNDTTNEINVNVLGQLHVQNNMTVGAGGSYYGDGSTLTGVALVSDAASNVTRIANLEASNVDIWSNLYSNVIRIETLEDANTVQGVLITTVTNDLSDNAGRITTLEDANTVQGVLITTITNDLSDNAGRITTLEDANTVQGVLITTLTNDLSDNAGRITTLEDANTVQGGLITTLTNDLSDNAGRITTLEDANTVQGGLITTVTNDLSDNAGRITTLEDANTVQGVLITAVTNDLSDNAGRITTLEDANTVQGGLITTLTNDLSDNAGRITTLEDANTVQGGLITTLTNDLSDNAARIAVLDTDMTSNSGRIDALEPRVTNLEASNVDIWSNLALLTLDDVVNVNNATSNTVRFTNATTSLTASGNVTVSGNVTSTTALISNAATLGTTKEFVVTASGGAFYIDGVQQDSLELHQNQTYLFDLTNPGTSHPFRLATVPDGGGAQNGSGSIPASDYTTGTDYTSVANHLKFTVPPGAPSTLYYYCTIHSGMGGSMSVSPTAELIVSGRVVASGNVEASSFKGDGSQLTNIASNLQAITDNGNVTSNTVQFTNTGTSLVASGTVEAVSFVGSGAQLTDIASNLEQIVNNGNVTSNTILLTDATTGLVATGNVEALKFIGDGSALTNIASNLEQIANNGNVTSNTLLLTDATTGLVATGNVHAFKFIGDGSALSNLPAAGVWQEKGDGEIYFTASNVGISNADPGHNLSVGSNLYVDDDGSNVLVVTGNVKADYFSGDGSLLTNLPSGSGGVWSTNGDGEIYFINSNVGISNADPGHNLSVGSNLYVDDDGSNVLVVTGNVKADYFSGDGSLLTNLPSGSGGVWSTNGDGEIYFINSNVGISNADPGHNLSVGSNLYVDDDGSNVLVIDGNLTAESMTLGGIGIVPSYPLSSVTDTGNTTPHTIEFTNAETGIVVDSNIVVAGNVTAAYLYGDVSNVTGIASNLHQIVENGNVTSNTVQFSNATTGLVTTANVEVGGELTATGVVKLLSTSNVAQIKVDSNVVAEYTGPHDRPLRKYPEVAMTANDNSSTSGYSVVQSTQSTSPTETRKAWSLFNHVTSGSGGDTYHGDDGISPTPYNNADGTYQENPAESLGGVNGTWLYIRLPKKINLESVRLTSRYGLAQRTPRSGTFLGSNDAVNWTILSSFSDITLVDPAGSSSPEHTYTYNVNSTVKYEYFGFVWEKIGTNYYVNIEELELYGYEEGSGSLDTTLKSVYNVPATTGTQLEVYYDAKDLTTMPTIVTDLAGGDQNGTPGTGVTVADGAFVFDGTANGKITTSIINDSGDWVHSASVWVKVETGQVAVTSAYISFLGTTESSSTRIAFDYREDESAIRLGISAAYIQWNNVIVPNHWHHITYTYKGGSISGENYNLYVDGKYVEHSTTLNDAAILTLAQNTTLSLGQSHLATNYLKGSIANFRLYSKALNAEQVKELYDYQKDYFLGSKSQVTLYKGHLGVGVTEPSGQLELAGDERIQEYPPGPMDDYETLIPGHGVFCAYASSEFDTTLTVDKMFNKIVLLNADDRWRSSSGVYTATAGGSPAPTTSGSARLASNTPHGQWIVLKLPYQICLKQYNWVGLTTQDPKEGQVWGSNDGQSWSHVNSFTNGGDAWVAAGSNVSSYIAYENTRTITGNTTYYSYYAFIITMVVGNDNAAGLRELKFFGTPGPTTLDKGSLTLGRSLDVPRVSRYDVDTETPRPEKLLVDFDTTVNSSPTDISGKGNHGTFGGSAYYSSADKAFILANNPADVSSASTHYIEAELGNSETGNQYHSVSLWVKVLSGQNSSWRAIFESSENPRSGNGSISLYVKGGTDILVFAHGSSNLESDPISNLYFQWHHVVLTYDGANRKMYLDGELIKTVATTTWSGVVNMTLRLGKNNATSGNEGCDCHISNFKMYWQTALEPSEVKKLYNLGRTGRSMVISDTAVGIGKVPEAQLDVRGVANFERVGIGVDNPGKTLDVNGTTRSRKNAGWKSGTFDSTGVNMGPLADGTTDGAQIGWEFHVTFSAATAGSRVEIYGAYKHSGPLYAANEKWTFRFKEGVGTPDYSNYAELVNEAEPNADTYYAVIRVVNSIYNNTNVVAARHHFMSHSVGCHRSIGATIWQAQGYIDMGGESIDDRFNYLRLTSSSGNIKGQWTVFPITT